MNLLNKYKEWFLSAIILAVIFTIKLLTIDTVQVDGHSMDPNLAGGDRLVVYKPAKIERFDIVVADESEGNQEKRVVKRVIGMPGDTIEYRQDKLYVNGKSVDEPYLHDYLNKYADDQLKSEYAYSDLFYSIANTSQAFTQDSKGSSTFRVKVGKDEYYLLGDNRLISKDSREVGTFAADSIEGQVVFRIMPTYRIGKID